MNFRLAEKSDKQQLYRLWESAFGDCESDIDCFFDGVLEFENIAVCHDGGKILSMLSLLPASIVFPNSRNARAYCVYAAATDKRYRKRGIMSRLIDFAAETAANRKADMLFLHPADEMLYSYYEKNGFKRAFYIGDEINFSDIKDGFSYPYVAWDGQIIRLAERFCENRSLLCEYGYADYFHADNGIRINSFFSGNIKALANELSHKTGCKNIYVRLPEDDLSKARPQGMIRCLNNRSFDNNIYLGITLE